MARLEGRTAPEVPGDPFDGPHLVIVESDASLRAVLERDLSPFHLRVHAFGSCEEALAHVTRFGADVVVADTDAPVQGGFALTRSLRAVRRLQDLHILVSCEAGYSGAALEMARDTYGFDDLLPKPYTLRQLVEKLRTTAGVNTGAFRFRRPPTILTKRPEPELVFMDHIGRILTDRLDGCLVCDRGDTAAHLYFRAGNLLTVDGGYVGAHEIGPELLRRGLIGSAKLSSLLRDWEQRLPERKTWVSRQLVESGLVPPQTLGEILGDQVGRRFQRVFGWRSGTFRFRAGEAPQPGDLRFSFQTPSLVWEALREYGNLGTLQTALERFPEPLRAASSAPDALVGVRLSKEERRLLARLARVAHREAVAEMGDQADRGHALVVLLLLLGRMESPLAKGGALRERLLDYASEIAGTSGGPNGGASEAAFGDSFETAYRYMNLGLMELGAQEFERCLALRPDEPRVLAYLGWCRYHASGQDDTAMRSSLDLIQKALRLDPGLGTAHVLKGQIQSLHGQSGAAQSAFLAALERDPGNEEATLGLQGLGRANQRRPSHPEAEPAGRPLPSVAETAAEASPTRGEGASDTGLGAARRGSPSGSPPRGSSRPAEAGRRGVTAAGRGSRLGAAIETTASERTSASRRNTVREASVPLAQTPLAQRRTAAIVPPAPQTALGDGLRPPSTVFPSPQQERPSPSPPGDEAGGGFSVVLLALQGGSGASEAPRQGSSYGRNLKANIIRCVLDAEGTLEEYRSDGLTCIFGHPADQPDHRERALALALELRELIAGYREHRGAGSPPLLVRAAVVATQRSWGEDGGGDAVYSQALGLAAVLLERAAPGEIHASAQAVRDLSDRFELELIPRHPGGTVYSLRGALHPTGGRGESPPAAAPLAARRGALAAEVTHGDLGGPVTHGPRIGGPEPGDTRSPTTSGIGPEAHNAVRQSHYSAAQRASVASSAPREPTGGAAESPSGRVLRGNGGADYAPGDVLAGHYTIVRRLGDGSMGRVYEALDRSLDRKVAIKMMSPQSVGTGQSRDRFREEARALASVNCRQIIQIYFMDLEHEPPFLVLEHVDGANLREVLRSRGRLPVRQALQIGAEVVRGLRAAAMKGIIHRDINPNNVMLSNDGDVKIGDFGLAKRVLQDLSLTAAGALLGTPLYMAPEQWHNQEMDFRTDIYGLGTSMYHMICGRPPFEADSVASVMLQHLETDLPRDVLAVPGVGPDTYAVLRCMTAKDPRQRPASYDDLLRDMVALLGDPRTPTRKVIF